MVVATMALDTLLLLSIAVVVIATLVPTTDAQGVPARDLATSAVNLDPLHTIETILRWGSRTQQYDNLVLNVLLFVPFGWAMALKARNSHPILVATAAGALLSVLVEAGQYLLPLSRSTDVDDVILNTLGTIVGAFVAVLLLPAARWLVHGRSDRPAARARA